VRLPPAERPTEASAARQGEAVWPKERDEALKRWMKLRKGSLVERLFIDARGSGGGQPLAAFLRSFRSKDWREFRLSAKDANEVRTFSSRFDSTGQPSWRDDRHPRCLRAVRRLRTRAGCFSFFQIQRGGLGPNTVDRLSSMADGRRPTLQSMTT